MYSLINTNFTQWTFYSTYCVVIKYNFVSNGRSQYYPGSGCPRCKVVDFQIKYIYRTDNTMTKGKGTDVKQWYTKQYRKLKSEHHEPLLQQRVNSGAPEYTQNFSLKRMYVCLSSVLYNDWSIILMYYPNYYLYLFYIVICTYLYFRRTAGIPPVCTPDVKGMNILYNKGDIYICYFLNGWTP